MPAIPARVPFFAALALCVSNVLSAADAADSVAWRWGVSIPMRDGVHLSGNLYLPKNQPAPAPCIFSITPYTAQLAHARGMDFAPRGYPFLVVDTRGRGNSEGTFKPFANEARDGYDIVEWLAKQ